MMTVLVWQLRYFPAASSYNDVARSNLVTIEDRDMVIATPSRVVQDSGDQLTATWQIHSVPTSKWDWYRPHPLRSLSSSSFFSLTTSFAFVFLSRLS
jgi:hypothetical protein